MSEIDLTHRSGSGASGLAGSVDVAAAAKKPTPDQRLTDVERQIKAAEAAFAECQRQHLATMHQLRAEYNEVSHLLSQAAYERNQRIAHAGAEKHKEYRDACARSDQAAGAVQEVRDKIGRLDQVLKRTLSEDARTDYNRFGNETPSAAARQLEADQAKARTRLATLQLELAEAERRAGDAAEWRNDAQEALSAP